MSRSKDLRPAGETPRMVVPQRGVATPSRALVRMGLRALLCLGLLALLPLCLSPVRATEVGTAGRPLGKIVGLKISGLNPGPFPKPAAQPKLDPLPPVAEISKPAEVKPMEITLAEVKPAEPVRVAEIVPPPAPPAPKQSAYCASIADAAADARFAWQKDQLAVLEKQVEARIAQLETKRAEYESWLARRNAFLAKADEGVVAIYTKMRADSAALQLANMPDDSAAAILTKLNARTASAILSEMEAARAAQLARRMTEMGKTDVSKTDAGKTDAVKSETGKSDTGKKAREGEKS